MSDLVQDYFKRDLSDEDFESMAQGLREDPAAAERFAALAQQDYERLGLPLAEPPRRSRPRRGLWLWVLLGLGATGMAWSLWDRETPLALVDKAESQMQVKAMKPKASALATDKYHLIVRAQGDRAYTLSLLPRPQGRLEAQVRDAQGRPVASLGSAEGVWAWDCLRENGSPAEPGIYEINVKGDQGHWSQWVEIRRD